MLAKNGPSKNKFLDIILGLRLLFLYVIFSLTIGEFHPFSKFPMFSSFPDNSSYYYFSDINNTPITPKENGNVYCSEISDLIEVRIKENLTTKNYTEKELEAATQAIKYIAGRYNNSGCWRKGNRVRLRKREFYLVNNKIEQRDILLAEWEQK